ncbi:hypothetical protein [Lysinibacillus capsici]|uniref:hypothetical protein n=1 Tax=Lysinibacillus capsici TaxID=2115968 RepID=UPI0034E3EBD8
MTLTTQQIQFNKQLYKTYNGQVVCLGNFTTPKAALHFECKSCYAKFYANCSDIISKNKNKRHLCFHNNSDRFGERKKHVIKPYPDSIKFNVWKSFNKNKDVYLVAKECNLAPNKVHNILASGNL